MTLTAEAAVACAVCGSRDHQPLFFPRRSPGPVVRCRQCGLVFVSQRLDQRALIFDGPELGGAPPDTAISASLADVRSSWEWPVLEMKEGEGPALERNNALALDRLTRWAAPPGRLLDFGCGGGFFLNAARARGWETTGLEPLPFAAAYARLTFGISVVADTLRDDTFAAESFAAITALQVFEHLPYPREDLGRLARSLRPGGVLLVEVPNFDTWTVKLLRGRHRHFVLDHLNFFTLRTLTRLFETAGLEVVEHYFPVRYLTLRHFIQDWLGRALPQPVARGVQSLAARLGWDKRVVRMNLGDIVAVLGRKPAK